MFSTFSVLYWVIFFFIFISVKILLSSLSLSLNVKQDLQRLSLKTNQLLKWSRFLSQTGWFVQDWNGSGTNVRLCILCMCMSLPRWTWRQLRPQSYSQDKGAVKMETVKGGGCWWCQSECSPRTGEWGRRSAVVLSSSGWSAARSCCRGWNPQERLRELRQQHFTLKTVSQNQNQNLRSSSYETRLTILVRQHQQLLALLASLRVAQDESQADVGERWKVTYGVLRHGAQSVVHHLLPHLLLHRLPAGDRGGRQV